MKRKTDKAVQMVLDWFSDYHREIITEEEARELLRRLPRALKALQRIHEFIRKPNRRKA